ncbi:MAG: hypothetical protein ACTSRT_06835 [Promethearchaeota archaeon]
MNNFGLTEGNNEVIDDLIRSPGSATEEKLVRALYKSIEKAYKKFQVDIQKVLVNEKKENWRAVNLDYFNELLRDSEVWASCTSC